MSLQKPKLNQYESVQLASVTAATATAQSAAVKLPITYRTLTFEMDLTAAAAAVGDTLDVTVQTKVDQSNWLDVVHFTQALGNGGAKRFVASVTTGVNQTMYETGTALTAGSVRNIFGDEWRVSYAIVDGGAHGQSFTFAVWVNAQ